MKKWVLAAALAAVVVAALLGLGMRARPSAAQDCDDWANQTAERVAIARQLLYPPERQEETTGSVEGDAQALFDLAREQADSDPPEGADNLNGDLIEAFAAGSAALGGEGGASPDAQVAFAKAIVYNADLRLAYLLDGC